MRTTLALSLALALTGASWAQDTEPAPTPDPPVVVVEAGTVTIASRGKDVRDVLFDLFDQAGRNFVIEPNVRHVLYLALQGVEFEEALDIVCQQASLTYEIDGGIYYISSRPKAPAGAPPVTIAKPVRVTDSQLQRRLTTRLRMTDLREVFAEFSKQTGVAITVSPDVPKYKLDAFLVNTSLRYALDVTTKAAKLAWSRTDTNSILVDVERKKG